MKRKSGAGYEEREVKTVIRNASAFYPAHEEHQDYLFKNPDGYCNHWERFVWDAENQPELPQLDDFKAQLGRTQETASINQYLSSFIIK
eukprot:UN07424